MVSRLSAGPRPLKRVLDSDHGHGAGPVCIALLRGVNVGKGRRVPMADFKQVLTDLGHQQALTLLNSGNAVFRAATPRADPADMAQAVADGLQARLGLAVPVVVKTLGELEAIVADNPFAPDDPSRLLVAFAPSDSALASLAPLLAVAQAPDAFHLGPRAGYLHCPQGLLQSPLGEALLGRAGRATTTRNWATVGKLLALARSLAA